MHTPSMTRFAAAFLSPFTVRVRLRISFARLGIPAAFCFLLGAALCAQAQTVQEISLVTNDLVYDPFSAKIYASVPSRAGSIGNSIARIDPITGTVEATVFVGSEPDKLALSDDGQFLYVGLDGANAVRRFNLATQTAGLQFSIGSGTFGPYYVGDLAVPPGQPHSVAVARNYFNLSPSNDGIAIYDDGVQRPNIVKRGSLVFDLIAFSNSASRLYAQNNETTSFDFIKLNVDAQGVSVADSVDNLLTGFGFFISFDKNSSLVYYSNGLTADAEAETHHGRLYLPSSSPYWILPDSINGRIFALTGGTTPYTDTYDAVVTSYDAKTLLPLGSFVIPSAYIFTGYIPISRLIKAGDDTMAFQTNNGKVFLIRGLDFPGLASFTLSANTIQSGGRVTGTVTLTRPAPPGGVLVYLSTTITDSSMLVPSTITIPAGATTQTFTVSTHAVAASQSAIITASYGAQSLTTPLAMLDSASDPVFPSNIRVINLPTSDLVYEPVSKQLYASVPQSAVGIGNSIVSLDPSAGNIGPFTFIGYEPNKLAVSDDGHYLYIGTDGDGAVHRFDLLTQNPNLTFSLGAGTNYAEKLIVMPGAPRSVVVSSYRYGYQANLSGVLIYDDDIARPKMNSTFVGTGLTSSAIPGRLYGATGDMLQRMTVDASGVSALDSARGMISGPSSEIKYDAGRIYTPSGQVIDPESYQLMGTFSGLGFGVPVLPDSADNRVFFMTDGYYGYGSVTGYLLIYDPNTFLPVESYVVPGIVGNVSGLCRWAPNQLAFRTTGGQIYLIDASPAVLASVRAVPSSVEGGKTVQGTVTLSNVAPVGGLSVSLSSDTPSVASVPASVFVPAGSESVSFPVTTYAGSAAPNVTITASYSAVNVTTSLTVTKDDTLVQLPNADGMAGQSVLLRAAIRRFPDGAVVGGETITFQIDGNSIGAATTAANGIASMNYTVPTSLSNGDHTLTATFAGDSNYNASTKNAVLSIHTGYNTLLQLPAVSGIAGQNALLRAAIRRLPDGVFLAGKSVTFQIDGTTVGSATTQSNYIASRNYTVSASLGPGNHALSASFAGDADYNASTQTAILTVSYNTFVQTGNMSGTAGQQVFLRAALRRYPDGQYVSGKSVAFQIDGSTVATFTTNPSGLASGYYTLPSNLSSGSHTLKAVFTGDGGYNASSQTATLTVNP